MTSANERFEAKIDRDGPMPPPDTGLATCCYQWLAGKSDGWGVFWYDRRMMRAHQVAWLLAGNELPVHPLTIDHLCRNKACQRIDHLRVATNREQQHNTGLRKDNASGVRGVSWDKESGKWRVRVGNTFGGRFSNLKEAKAAYLALRERLHGS